MATNEREREKEGKGKGKGEAHVAKTIPFLPAAYIFPKTKDERNERWETVVGGKENGGGAQGSGGCGMWEEDLDE